MDDVTQPDEEENMAYRTRSWFPVLLGLLVLGAFLAVPPAASADDGITIDPASCMQKVFGTPVTNANRLNCTANDIKLSKATSVSPTTCVEGTTFTLTATFETVVTANSRYDAGFFFRIDGGPNARGDGSSADGVCSLSQLNTAPPPPLNLDGDTCGDLNSGTFELTFTIPNVFCHDSDGDGFLNLPNCTSWHSNQGTLCTQGDENGSKPDTKSKCVCDDTFQVPVTVESPSGAVIKTATKAVVTYEVKVKNNSTTRTVKINSLIDDVYGDLTLLAGAPTACSSLIGNTLAPGATSSACQFAHQYNNPGTVGDKTNTVTAELEDTGNGTKVNVTGFTTINVNLNVGP
ncbi:MAG TPA: hypothetical protein VGL03_13560 [Thermoanaerobaculia bacterium]|jgi:hypothetical protein